MILGFIEEIDEYVYAKIKEFVCKMYGKKNFKSVNELRLELFLQKYKPRSGDAVISCVKKWITAFFHHATKF